MSRRLIFSGLLWLLVGHAVFAAEVRYFAVWSYLENELAGEIPAGGESGRRLGYWAVEFNGSEEVLGASYHGSDGRKWLSVRYVEVDDKIYAEILTPAGLVVSRKSTTLSSRKPSWSQKAEEGARNGAQGHD